MGIEVRNDGVPTALRDSMTRVPWLAVCSFVVISFGIAWLVAMPLWRADPESNQFMLLLPLIAMAMMYTPAVATLFVIVVFRTPRQERLRFLGMWPMRPAKRVVGQIFLGLALPIAVVVLGIALSALFGLVKLDLVGFSGFAEALNQQAEASPIDLGPLPPIGIMVLSQLVLIPLGAVFNSLLSFGEEIGWRGWLLPALRPLGTWPVLVLSGAIWGLWHSPLILLGYNFGLTDWRGVAYMTAGCIAWGVLLGWLRLRSGSVWPAVIAHGSLNAVGGLIGLLIAADSKLDLAIVGPLGVVTWVAAAIAIAVLVMLGQFKRQPALAEKRQSAV